MSDLMTIDQIHTEEAWPRQVSLFADDEAHAEFVAEWEDSCSWFQEKLAQLTRPEITITVISGKPTLQKNGISLGQFPSPEQAREAAAVLSPMLAKAVDCKSIIEAIVDNGGEVL